VGATTRHELFRADGSSVYIEVARDRAHIRIEVITYGGDDKKGRRMAENFAAAMNEHCAIEFYECGEMWKLAEEYKKARAAERGTGKGE